MFVLKFVLLISCMVFAWCSYSQSGPIQFQINGNIRGLNNDTVIITVNQYDAKGTRLKADTFSAAAKNDHFALEGALPGPRYVWASFGRNKNFSFFIENGKININGDVTSPDNISVTGTAGNNDQTSSRRITNEMYGRIKTLRLKMKDMSPDLDEYKNISMQVDAKFDSIQAYELAFIESHPNSLASSTYLYVLQDKIPLKDLEYLYSRLSPDVKNTGFGFIVKDKIAARKLVAIGNAAPAFTSADTSGNTISLSSFRGKYVLLEFWASWCVPCRQQSPHLIEVYNKYRHKGFTIVQYSLDDKKAEQKWKEAIRKDQLVWTQLSDLNGFDSKVTKLYGVQPIPDNFLIDPNGKIIGRRLEGKELDDMLEQLIKK
jgi:peroxiredoxin